MLKDACSLPLGSVRLTEAFLPSGKPSNKDMQGGPPPRGRAELDAVDWWPRKGGRLVGIGGTIRNLAAATLKRARHAGHRRAGLRADAGRAGGADRGAGRQAGLQARLDPRHQARPQRRDPGRRPRAGQADGRGRLRRDRGLGGRPAGGDLLRVPAGGLGPAAVRGRAAGVGGQPRPPLPHRRQARRPRGQAVAASCSTRSRRPGSTTTATPSASSCGRPASCTTSAWRSTTTTITTTPPT